MERIFEIIAKEIGKKYSQVEAAVNLLDEGNTVPFIARYRKEVTGELKDEELRTIEDRLKYLRNLEERRSEIIRLIDEQGQLTEDLQEKIKAAEKLQELEDLYLPYKPKKRTRAIVAREKGLAPLAEAMLIAHAKEDPFTLAGQFITEEVANEEEALQGAMDIVAEDISTRADVRQYLREKMWKEGRIVTELVGDDEELKKGFIQYGKDEEGNLYEEPIHRIPSHRILAINRGEKLGVLKVSFNVPNDVYVAYIEGQLEVGDSSFGEYLHAASADSYKRLLYPALERELRNLLTEQADEQAIKVFGTNLKNLLLQAPLTGHVIMGLDPGYRTGCKMAIIDRQGNVLDFGTYYITHSEQRQVEARRELAHKIRQFGVTLISIGNGTASYETEQFVSQLLESENLGAHYLITNEAGASVYSASKLAGEELPDLDVSIRGAVSIARRVQDPLAEAVKIDPKSIGVGQYQHDVNQKELSEALDQVVETVVNHVGVELNTASPAILKHVVGISSTVANNIVAYRKDNGAFKSRKELLKVARLGPAAFTQCAGFLRLQGGENPLDNTAIHPESYGLATEIIEALGYKIEDLKNKEVLQTLQEQLPKLDVEETAKRFGAGVPTLRDIIDSLMKPGRDPREDLPAPLTRKQVLKLEDIQVGTIVKGTVHNVVDFGAFVDFGLKVNGLLHRSEFCRRDEHPSDVLAVGDIIEAEIISVEPGRNRIGLSLKKQRAELQPRESVKKEATKKEFTNKKYPNRKAAKSSGKLQKKQQSKNSSHSLSEALKKLQERFS